MLLLTGAWRFLWRVFAQYPPHSVILQGNTHSPSENASAVLAVCGEGISLTSNQVSVSRRSNVSLIETGSDSSLFGASQVFLKGNTLNCALAAPQHPVSLPSALRRIADRLLCRRGQSEAYSEHHQLDRAAAAN